MYFMLGFFPWVSGDIKVWRKMKKIIKYSHTHRTYSFCYINNTINDYIISDDKLRILAQSTHQCIRIIKHLQCNWNNRLLKLNDNTMIIWGSNKIYLLNIKTYKINKIKDQSLGGIYWLNVNGNE